MITHCFRVFLGPGTYALNGYVYSSLAGFLHLVPKSNNQKQNEKEDQVMSVEVHAPGQETAVPSIGDIVTAKITSVNPRYDIKRFSYIFFPSYDVHTVNKDY